jgi:hypothetical protein
MEEDLECALVGEKRGRGIEIGRKKMVGWMGGPHHLIHHATLPPGSPAIGCVDKFFS